MRVRVPAVVLRPDGTKAQGVRVIAEPVQPLEGLPLPSEAVVTYTDSSGAVELYLDAAHYRLDFIPLEDLPRMSRFVQVLNQPALDRAEYTLSKGRTVTGTVISRVNGSEQPAPFASVRFFRVVTAAGNQPGSILLAEGITDSTATYTIALPAR
jgi:hypothetical protein